MISIGKKSAFPGRRPRKLPRDGAVVATLDIGAAKTACFIARVMPGAMGPSGTSEIDCDITGGGIYGAQAVTGSRKAGALGGLTAREEAIRSAIEAAETVAGERVDTVHVCVPGQAIRYTHVGIDLDIASGFVTADDIVESLQAGAELMTPQGAHLLHAIPVSYAVDGELAGTDPRGLRAQRLTTRLMGVHTSQTTTANLQAVVENAGLSVGSFLATPLMMARSVLVEDEKDLGVLVIDIGAQNVSYAVYQDGRPAGCGGIVPGAGHISRDIAQAFSTPIAHAERQKILHGTVFTSSADEHRFVDMIPMAGGEERQRVPRAELANVIMPRLEEIYETLMARIVEDQCPINHLRRVVLTGGGSQLEGVREHAERVFAMKARLGKPMMINGAPEAMTGPAFSACAGAVEEVSESYGTLKDFPETGVRSVSADYRQNASQNRVANIGGWLRSRF